MPPTPSPTYTVPKYNQATGEGTLSYTAKKYNTSVADLVAGNQGNTGIYYAGTDPRLREGAVLNIPGVTPGVVGGGAVDANPGIVSTTNYREGLNQGESSIFGLQNDPYQSFFDQLYGRSESSEDLDRRQARADAARKERGVQDEYGRYRAGLETLGIQSGLSRYAPNLQLDKMLQAEQLMRSDLEEIDQAEKLALAKADAARKDNDLDIMREQISLAEDLRKEKADAIAEANKMKFEREKFEKNYALDVQREKRLRAEGAAGGSTADRIKALFGGEDGEIAAGGEGEVAPTGLNVGRLKRFNGPKKRNKIGVTDDILNDIGTAIEAGASLEEAAQLLGLNQEQVDFVNLYME